MSRAQRLNRFVYRSMPTVNKQPARLTVHTRCNHNIFLMPGHKYTQWLPRRPAFLFHQAIMPGKHRHSGHRSIRHHRMRHQLYLRMPVDKVRNLRGRQHGSPSISQPLRRGWQHGHTYKVRIRTHRQIIGCHQQRHPVQVSPTIAQRIRQINRLSQCRRHIPRHYLTIHHRVTLRCIQSGHPRRQLTPRHSCRPSWRKSKNVRHHHRILPVSIIHPLTHKTIALLFPLSTYQHRLNKTIPFHQNRMIYLLFRILSEKELNSPVASRIIPDTSAAASSSSHISSSHHSCTTFPSRFPHLGIRHIEGAKIT